MTSWEGYEISQYGVDGKDILVADRQPDKVVLTDEEHDPQGRTLPPVDQRASGQNFSTVWLLPLRYNFFTINDSGWSTAIQKFPMYDAPDFGCIYHPENYPSVDLMTDANAKLNESIYNIIMGVQPVDYWDTALADWLNSGGQVYTNGLNEEYNAWKAGN